MVEPLAAIIARAYARRQSEGRRDGDTARLDWLNEVRGEEAMDDPTLCFIWGEDTSHTDLRGAIDLAVQHDLKFADAGDRLELAKRAAIDAALAATQGEKPL